MILFNIYWILFNSWRVAILPNMIHGNKPPPLYTKLNPIGYYTSDTYLNCDIIIAFNNWYIYLVIL